MVFDEDAVRDLLPMKELIPAMAGALAALSGGSVVQPMRVVVPVADHHGFFGVMPAYYGALGAKLVTFYPENQDVHTHHAVILLFRPETGEPLPRSTGASSQRCARRRPRRQRQTCSPAATHRCSL